MEISKITQSYWTEQDNEEVKIATDFKSLFVIANRILHRMPEPIVQVCGPIGTGGLGSVDANLNAFNIVIHELQSQGLNVFDQMPFEWPMQAIKFNLDASIYPEAILTDFYLPLFESGLITALYFMKGWESSKGANWEHAKALELGIKIIYL